MEASGNDSAAIGSKGTDETDRTGSGGAGYDTRAERELLLNLLGNRRIMQGKASNVGIYRFLYGERQGGDDRIETKEGSRREQDKVFETFTFVYVS